MACATEQNWDAGITSLPRILRSLAPEKPVASEAQDALVIRDHIHGAANMAGSSRRKVNRRDVLRRSAAVAATAAVAGGGSFWLGSRRRVAPSAGKKVIVIGIDGMDPVLSEQMLAAGLLPNLDGLRARGGYSKLATSIPPQSPVAWASFINGAGPGSHGIFDFLHRHPDQPSAPFYGGAETVEGVGYWEVGDYRLQLDFWPFNHKPPVTLLGRQGVPFWDYLDKAGIPFNVLRSAVQLSA